MLVLARLTVEGRDAGAEAVGGVTVPPAVALHISAWDVHPTCMRNMNACMSNHVTKIRSAHTINHHIEGSLPPTLVGRRKMTMKNKHIAAINPSNLSREELIISKL